MAKLFLMLALVACAYWYAQNYDAEFASYDVLMNTCDMSACRNGLRMNSEDCRGCLFDCGGQQLDNDMDNAIFGKTGPCADMGPCYVRCGERPFVMRRDALDNTSVAALTRPDLDGYSLDVLAAVSQRFCVAFTMKMLPKVELERWYNKRHLVENIMFSRSVDMSANVLTRKDNRRQNLPPLMSGTVKAVLKHYEGFGRIDNYTRLIALAYGDQPPSPVEDDDSDAVKRAAQLDAASWKFGSVENSEVWHFLKRSKWMDMRAIYQRVWDERRRRNLPVNRTDGLAKLNRSTSAEPYVFVDESIMADYHASLDDQLYTIDIDPKMSEPIEYVFGTAFGMHDDLKRNLTCIFLQLADDGTLDRLKEKWFSGAAALRSSVLLLLASAGAMALFLRHVS